MWLDNLAAWNASLSMKIIETETVSTVVSKSLKQKLFLYSCMKIIETKTVSIVERFWFKSDTTSCS